MLQKLVKQRKESFEIFKKEGREELAQKEQEEISIIEKYLPKQMDEATLTGVLEKIIAETGASSMRDMGKVMGMATKQLAGQADGKLISQIVKKLLG